MWFSLRVKILTHPVALQKRALLVRPGANMQLNLSFVDQQDSYTVWAHVDMIVSLQMCHSVCLRGSNTLLPAWENMAGMYLGKKKSLPATAAVIIR